MADCGEIRLMLGPFEDGELEPHEMQEVARHVAVCTGCEKLLGDYSLIGRELRTLTVSLPLEGFAEAVATRVRKHRLPWRTRLARKLDGAGQWMAAAAFASFTTAAVVLTVVFITPSARRYFARERAGGSSTAIAQRAAGEQTQRPAEAPAFAAIAEDSRAVISRLESAIPSVAVWSEPENGTTVIWLPEQGQ